MKWPGDPCRMLEAQERPIPIPANDWIEELGYKTGDYIFFYTDETGQILGIAPNQALTMHNESCNVE